MCAVRPDARTRTRNLTGNKINVVCFPCYTAEHGMRTEWEDDGIDINSSPALVLHRPVLFLQNKTQSYFSELAASRVSPLSPFHSRRFTFSVLLLCFILFFSFYSFKKLFSFIFNTILFSSFPFLLFYFVFFFPLFIVLFIFFVMIFLVLFFFRIQFTSFFSLHFIKCFYSFTFYRI